MEFIKNMTIAAIVPLFAVAVAFGMIQSDIQNLKLSQTENDSVNKQVFVLQSDLRHIQQNGVVLGKSITSLADRVTEQEIASGKVLVVLENQTKATQELTKTVTALTIAVGQLQGAQ